MSKLEAVARPPQHMEWLDAAKGFGIIAVVAGHLYSGMLRNMLFVWHMPLFFFLAGYTFRPSPALRSYASDKALRLLVPYAVFLLLMSVPDVIALAAHESFAKNLIHLAVNRIYGGRLLSGEFVAFWFITCLFLTQQVFNLLMVGFGASRTAAVMLVCLGLAYAWSAFSPRFLVPWNANICLMSLPMVYAGWQYRRSADGRWALVTLVAGLIAVCLSMAGAYRPFDMKVADFGTPVVTLLASLAVVTALLTVVRRLDSATMPASIHALVRLFAVFGRASLVIMFLHNQVQISLANRGIASVDVRFAAALLGPLALYLVIERFSWSRALLLGSIRDMKSLSRRSDPHVAA